MKKFTKLFTIILSIFTLLSFGLFGCYKKDNNGGDSTGYNQVSTLNGKSAEQIYRNAIPIDNYSFLIDYDISATIFVGDIPQSIQMSLSNKLNKSGNDFRQILTVDYGSRAVGNGTYQDFGTIITTTTFIDQTAYTFKRKVTTQGNTTTTAKIIKSKTNSSFEELLTTLGKTETQLLNPLHNFSSSSFDNVKINVNKNDPEDAYFELALQNEQSKAFVSEILAQISSTVEILSFSTTQYKVLITSTGEFEQAQIAFTVHANVDGTATAYKFTGKIDFSEIGTTVVSAPEDAESYD